MENDAHSPVLYFDGVCNLCNGVVQFVIRHDIKKQFRFAALQSVAGKRTLVEIGKSKKIAPDSVILFYKGRYYFKSSAALHVARLLGGGWALLYGAVVVPRVVRDWVYDVIAKHRYQWFGRQDSCMMPTRELQGRFLS